jgi:nitroreductase
MDFLDIAKSRQSCRSFDPERAVEGEKIEKIMEAARLAPSACNAQPYHFTVCSGDAARDVARATMGMGMNKFAADAPVMIVISEAAYNATAKIGAKIKDNDYRSIDIGIATAYLTAEAEALGVQSCIIGWLDSKKIGKICGFCDTVRLVIALGYALPDDTHREKKRKPKDELITYITESKDKD